MNERELDLLADRIEQEMAAHRLPVRVMGALVSARLITYQMTTAPGVRLESIRALSSDLARLLRVVSVRVTQGDGLVLIELPRSDAKPVELLRMLEKLDDRPDVTACLGSTSDGTPLLLRLPSPDVAHVLVAGTTGSGKTVLLRGMVLSLALRHRTNGLGLFLIDPRGGSALGMFAGLPQLMAPVLSEHAQVQDALGWLVGEMERRDANGHESTPAEVVVVDELADLLAQDRKGVIETSLTRLAARGRNVGIHVVAATQRPGAESVSGMMKANFPVRIVGRVASADDARVAAGQRQTGAERLAGRGDFVLVSGSGVIRFTAALVTPEEIEVVKVRAGWSASPPHLPTTEAPQDVDLQAMADRLRPWWLEHGGEYGSKTKAVKLLFGIEAPPGGMFWEQTMAVIRLVDSTSTPPA